MAEMTKYKVMCIQADGQTFTEKTDLLSSTKDEPGALERASWHLEGPHHHSDGTDVVVGVLITRYKED